MAFFSPDMEALLDIYQRESFEQLEELDGCLVDAEVQGGFTPSCVNAIFRVVHSMKSSAAMMGMADFSTCAHKLEDLFQLLRDDPQVAQGLQEQVSGALYAFSDYARSELERTSDDGYQPASAAAVLQVIEQAAAALGGEPADDDAAPTSADAGKQEAGPVGGRAAAPVVAEGAEAAKGQAAAGTSEATGAAAATDEPALATDAALAEPMPEAGEAAPCEEHVLHVYLTEDCRMENVRAFMVVRRAQEHCQQVASVPSDLEKEGVDQLIRTDGLLVCALTSNVDAVQEAIEALPYVQRVEREAAAAATEAASDEEAPGEFKAAEVSEADGSAKGEVSHASLAKFTTVSRAQVEKLRSITGELAVFGNALRHAVTSDDAELDLESLLVRQQRLLAELESATAALSLTPVRTVVSRFYRVVHEIARDEGKRVTFEVSGEDIEIDSGLLDAVSAPLIHLIRNAVDHGIEDAQQRVLSGKDPVGSVRLAVRSLNGMIEFRVSDDGAGVSDAQVLSHAQKAGLLDKPVEHYTHEEALDLLFRAGFSTNSEVSRYSGRGVGTDVVRDVAMELGGVASVESQEGRGSTFILAVPASMTMQSCVHLLVGRHTCLVPVRAIRRICLPEQAQAGLSVGGGAQWFTQLDQTMPVLDLFQLFGEQCAADETPLLTIVDGPNGAAALLTGQAVEQSMVVEQPLPALVAHRYASDLGISGCAVLANGLLGLVMNVGQLVQLLKRGGVQHG